MRMIGLFLAACAALLFAANAPAQTVVTVDLSTASLSWQWARGTGGDATDFVIACTTQGAGALPTPLPDHLVPVRPAPNSDGNYSVPIADFVTAPGSYSCEVSAQNAFARSSGNPTIAFVAGSPPSAPQQLIIQSAP